MPRKMRLADIEEVFACLSKLDSDPRTELVFEDAYTLLVAVALSAQATDVSVNKATGRLFAAANTPEKMVALGVEEVKSYIKTIGLFNTKAENVIKLSQMLLDNHNGEVPEDREALESLPGVGRKTANVVLNTAFGQPTIAVDTHIYRVANRTAIASGKTVLEVEKKLIKFIPDEFKVPAHHLMILHGRYVCKARSPHCTDCTLLDLCEYEEKNI